MHNEYRPGLQLLALGQLVPCSCKGGNIQDIVTRFGAAFVALGGSYDPAEVDQLIRSPQASFAAE